MANEQIATRFKTAHRRSSTAPGSAYRNRSAHCGRNHMLSGANRIGVVHQVETRECHLRSKRGRDAGAGRLRAGSADIASPQRRRHRIEHVRGINSLAGGAEHLRAEIRRENEEVERTKLHLRNPPSTIARYKVRRRSSRLRSRPDRSHCPAVGKSRQGDVARNGEVRRLAEEVRLVGGDGVDQMDAFLLKAATAGRDVCNSPSSWRCRLPQTAPQPPLDHGLSWPPGILMPL